MSTFRRKSVDRKNGFLRRKLAYLHEVARDDVVRSPDATGENAIKRQGTEKLLVASGEPNRLLALVELALERVDEITTSCHGRVGGGRAGVHGHAL